MLPDLSEVLYWAAGWIAVVAVLLGLAVWITGSAAAWIGVATFLTVSAAIWGLGQLGLWVSALKHWREKRPRS